ncbi:MAG: DUF1700 domain-containing protein [Oscillospiraceae bacterium]|nr:DUF1700 domain-containing protein [Oscillospiraceae bacterium]
MNKSEFLQKLKEDLSSLTDEERAGALKYYEEYFADAGTDNEEEIISEFESPENLANKIKNEIEENKDNGDSTDSSEIKVENILKEETENPKIDFNNYTYENVSSTYNNNDSTVKNNSNSSDNSSNSYKSKKSGSNTWKFVLLLCTFPIWLPVATGLASAAFGIFMGLLGVSFAIAAIAVAGYIMVGAGFVSIGYGISSLFIHFAFSQAFYPIGAGLIIAGIGMILAYLFSKLSAFVFKSEFKLAGSVIRGIANKFSRQGA